MAVNAGGAVLVVGNLTTDLIVHGVEALPAWGREVAGLGHRKTASGQAAYLAFGLRALGLPTQVFGVVGADAEGAAIREQLQACGVDADAIEVSQDAPTAITVALVRADGERAFVSDFACQRLLDASMLERRAPAVENSRALCLVGLFNLPELRPDDVLPLFARAQAAGVPTMLDTGWDPGSWPPATVAATRRLLLHTDIFLPNRDEAEALTGLRDAEAAAQAFAREGPAIVVVKCGVDGAVGLAHGHTERVPAFDVAVTDAVGAGDSFDAAFLWAHLQGSGFRDCLTFASAAAAIHVSRETDRHASVEEVHELLAASAAREHCEAGTA